MAEKEMTKAERKAALKAAKAAAKEEANKVHYRLNSHYPLFQDTYTLPFVLYPLLRF